nr:AraC family transcriptional regulator [Tissierella sp.]
MSNTVFEFKNEDISNLPISLLYASKSRYQEDWHSTMHMHPFTELFYVVKGKGLFIVEDTKINVEEDDLVIVNSNVSHTESSLDSSPLEYIVLGFNGMSIVLDNKLNAEKDNLYNYSKHNYKSYKTEVLFFMDLILKEVKEKEENYENICHNLLQILVLNIIRNTHAKLTMSPTSDINKECSYVQKYIDIHYASDITLDYLASIVFMNKYYLIHEFKKYIGTSPIEYLINKRISISKTLLETTDYSMEQISQIVGFNSQSYFNQIFKKRVGKTPTLFRKEIEKKKK